MDQQLKQPIVTKNKTLPMTMTFLWLLSCLTYSTIFSSVFVILIKKKRLCVNTVLKTPKVFWCLGVIWIKSGFAVFKNINFFISFFCFPYPVSSYSFVSLFCTDSLPFFLSLLVFISFILLSFLFLLFFCLSFYFLYIDLLFWVVVIFFLLSSIFLPTFCTFSHVSFSFSSFVSLFLFLAFNFCEFFTFFLFHFFAMYSFFVKCCEYFIYACLISSSFLFLSLYISLFSRVNLTFIAAGYNICLSIQIQKT